MKSMMKICSIDVAFPSLVFVYSIYGNRINNTISCSDQQVSNKMMEMLHRCYIFLSLEKLNFLRILPFTYEMNLSYGGGDFFYIGCFGNIKKN